MKDSSPSTPPDAECWVCRDANSTSGNPIISRVCRCIGSVGSVHQNCIDRWVFQNERIECPSCGFPYSIVYTFPRVLVYPESIFSKIKLVSTGFLLPVLTKLIILIPGLLLRFVIAPLVIGFIYYGERAWLRHPLIVSWIQWFEIFTYGTISLFLMRLTIFGFKHWSRHIGHLQRRQQQENLSMNRRAQALDPAFVADDVNQPHPHNLGLEVVDEDWEDEDSESEDIDDESFCDLSKTGFVASTHDWIDLVAKQCGVDDSLLFSLVRDLVIVGPLAFSLRTPQGLVIIFTIFVVTWALLQLWLPRRRINNPQRRYEEVVERLRDLTSGEVKYLYATYILETSLFSFFFPTLAGVVVHYGTAPFLAKAPDSLSSFLEELNIFKVVMYWIIGTLCSLVLMATMYNIISPLFAPGVELFYIRSADFRSLDTHALRLNLMFTRVFDVGPLQLALDFLAILVFEIGALLFFIAMPCWVTFGIREAVFGDLSSGRLSLPLSFGVPPRSELSFRHKVAGMQQFLKVSRKFGSYNISEHLVPESRSEHRVETNALNHLAKLISSNSQATLKTTLSLSLDDTEPLYNLKALALAVAALRNDTVILRKFPLLERRDWSNISNTWFMLRILASSGYVCPACFLNVGCQLGLFETLNLTSLSSSSNRQPSEGGKPGHKSETLIDLLRQEGNTTNNFPLTNVVLVDPIPASQWKTPWDFTRVVYVDEPNKSTTNRLFGNYSTVHEHQRLMTASGALQEKVPWSPEKVLDWSEDSMVCLVLLLITSLFRIPGFGLISRFVLNLFLHHSGLVFFLQNFGLISMLLVFFTCLTQFPIRKIQLRFLYPFALLFGRQIGMETFLFDAERLNLIDLFLKDENLDHLDVPIVPTEAILLRREVILPKEKVPSHYRLRLFVFAMFFLLFGTVIFWLPFISIFLLMLCVPLSTVSMILGSGCIFFFLLDPSKFLECVFLAHGLIVVLLGFTLLSVYWALSKLSLQKLSRETFFYICKVKRHVGVCKNLARKDSGVENYELEKMLHDVGKVPHAEPRPIPVPAPDDNNENRGVPVQ